MRIGWRGVVFTRLEKADGGAAAGGVAGREGGEGNRARTTADQVTDTGADTPLLGPKSKNGGGGGAGDATVRRRKGADKGDDGKAGGRDGAGAGGPPQGGGSSVKQGGAGGGEGSGADQAVETMRYDRMAIAYLSLILLPLVVGYSLKKLVMDEHAGWYSWALQSVTVGGDLWVVFSYGVDWWRGGSWMRVLGVGEGL